MKKILLFVLFTVISFANFSQEVSKTREEEALTYIQKGHAKAEAGDWKGALNEYNTAVGFDPRNAEAYYGRALAAQTLKDYRSAVNDYSKVIYLNDSDANAYYGRGMCYFELGKKNNSCIDLSKASGLGNADAATAMMNYCN
jgi:tetratricopeptide (TPR) repeat protein